jgi:hypothetical protein
VYDPVEGFYPPREPLWGLALVYAVALAIAVRVLF